MFNFIKKVFSNDDINQAWKEGSLEKFYPIFNSPYHSKKLSRTDYLNLYTGRIYSCVTTIADSISDLDYHLLRVEWSDKSIDHDYMKFINSAFLESISSFLKLNWEAYVYKSMIWSKIDELFILRPDLITIDQDASSNIIWYFYSAWWKRYRFLPEQLIIFKNFSPFSALWSIGRGISDVQAIAIQAETDNAVMNWNWNFFKNNASAWDIIEVPDQVDEDAKKRFSTAWNNEFRWVNNSHKLALLDNGMKYIQQSRNQKEMDFVEQRRFTRDEILWIFKVPKAIIGLWEGVNVWNVKAFEIIFARRTIKPLATQIMETLNEQLFKWIWYFEFINIVPTDVEELKTSLEVWAITINEYRNAIWYGKLKEGDVLKVNPMQIAEVNHENEVVKEITNFKQVNNNSFIKNVNIEWILKKYLKGSDEYEQKRWKKKIVRNDQYEERYKKELLRIFKIQEKDILDQIKNQKAFTKPKWNTLKYLTLYHTFISPIQEDIVKSEWNIALEEIMLDAAFEIWNPQTSKWLKDNIDKFAKEVDGTTRDQIMNEIDKWNKEWLWVDVISERISRKFEILSTSRLENIVRTETIRAWSYATQKAWEDSEVVEWKQWWTAQDERTCSHCWPLHWKEIWLSDNFFKKGDSYNGLKLDYSDTPASPLHPRCRCSLIPILKRGEEIKPIFERLNTWDKWISELEVWDIIKNNIDSLNNTFFTETQEWKMFWKQLFNEILISQEKISSMFNNELGIYSPKTINVKWSQSKLLNEFIKWESLWSNLIKSLNDNEYLKYKDQRIRLWAIDLLIWQYDRHIWNIMLDESKNLVAIDNDMITKFKESYDINQSLIKIRESFFEVNALRKETPTKLELYQWLLENINSIDYEKITPIIEMRLWKQDPFLKKHKNLNDWIKNNKREAVKYIEDEIDFIIN